MSEVENHTNLPNKNGRLFLLLLNRLK